MKPVGNLLRLVRILTTLSPDIWALRRYDSDGCDMRPSDRFAQDLITLGPVFV